MGWFWEGLGRRFGGVLGASCGLLGASQGVFWGFKMDPQHGAILGWFGVVLGGVLGGSWGRLGVYLGRLRVCFGGVLRLGCVLGRLRGDLGVLGCLEGSWGHMAGFWEPLSGTVWGRKFWGWY